MLRKETVKKSHSHDINHSRKWYHCKWINAERLTDRRQTKLQTDLIYDSPDMSIFNPQLWHKNIKVQLADNGTNNVGGECDVSGHPGKLSYRQQFRRRTYNVRGYDLLWGRYFAVLISRQTLPNSFMYF